MTVQPLTAPRRPVPAVLRRLLSGGLRIWKPVAVQAAVTLVLALGYVWLGDVCVRVLVAEHRADAALTASSLASTLSSALNERFALVRGLTAFVEVASGSGNLADQFPRYAEGLRRSVVGVRNIAAAPDFVVRIVYPVEGNEKVLGNDLLRDSRPGFAETVRRAIISRDVTVHGPVNLLQGGQGLIARQIVNGPGKPWGAVGLVFDVGAILNEVRFDRVPAHLGFAVVTDTGQQVAGDALAWKSDPLVERINLPDGYWHLALAPRTSWEVLTHDDPAYRGFQIAFLLLSLLIEAVTLMAIGRRHALERQVDLRTAELGRAKNELEQFAYATAHDLQEPLRVIASYAQLLERQQKGKLDEESEGFIREIADGAGRLKMLLRDVQLFLAEDRVPLSCGVISASDALQAALAALKRRIADAGACVTVAELPSVQADERLLRKIFVVLIDNAVEYRHPYRAAEVEISHRRVEGHDMIDVRDNGIGIEPRYRNQIFEVFRRLHSRDEHPGTGMGLAIARKMVERLGGRITVVSSPGVGSTFSIHLPYSAFRGSP
ncbi:signal transduction histidine kinase [Azospirillum lipoferum]|uniref:histidine kinase n=1 Tax=Azospirillum lipoferum TaxID=193 RepID=A0A5A9GUK7_AZOLI|nr:MULTISPECIES: ATP-binding protein [Azospirillum]KAA0597264.1 histidine kinase [Azospirillum lipoferum]MCP1608783.1 signal transduction histidine kinase [Azospirillum lipoferum]MDW5535902.1 ATP-binding protein [Azospirillum sp. NL1]